MNQKLHASLCVIICCFGLIGAAVAQQSITLDEPSVAGMSGFRALWDQPITVTEDGARELRDAVVKDRGQAAVWGGDATGPLAFDAQHRSLLIRFPDAARRIAEAVASGRQIQKVELVLPFLDEELWAPGAKNPDYPSDRGYRYRKNWGTDKLYREIRPNWHAVAHVLRKPWVADPKIGPTYNAAINGAVYWKRFGATDETEDRFARQLGPTEVSVHQPEGRMDVTSVVTDEQYGKTLGERLGVLANNGFVVRKWETYDARFTPPHVYEFSVGTGPRAILIRKPSLVVTFKDGTPATLDVPSSVDVKQIAEQHAKNPIGKPTAVLPTPAEIAALNEKLMARPAWMPEWQYAHVRQLMALEGGEVKPFYYRLAPGFAVRDVVTDLQRKAAKDKTITQSDIDYAVYLTWVDWIQSRPLRYYEGHLTASDSITVWYNFREALPEAVRDTFVRNWVAFLMPDRETETDPVQRRQYNNVSGRLVHPMVDDPRVGKGKDGTQAKGSGAQGDVYYKLTGDWRGNKSFFRGGFTAEVSTANFNSTATSGALLLGQIIGSDRAVADGRDGLMRFPFWMWTHSSGVGQEYVDHYYWAIATAGNKNFADFCEDPQDQFAGWSIINKTLNDLAGAYHPGLKKLFGPASRTYYEHVLGQQDGLYHILHVVSRKGVLSDTQTGTLPGLNTSAWGHDYPPTAVAMQSMSGPWADEWIFELVDEKPVPYRALLEKEGDPVTTFFGKNYGLSSIRSKPQRIHVLGQWRRKAERPNSMTDIGTLDMRIGFNETQIGNDYAGVISAQGKYRTYQHDNKLIMLAQPNVGIITNEAKERDFGQKKQPARDITSVQCTAALFNYEPNGPAWEIYVDDQKVDALPATAKLSQVVTIRDGVTYLAIRPLPTDDVGRDAEVTLTKSSPQPQAFHESILIQPALLINAHFYKSDAPITADAKKKLESARSGFVVEMGDSADSGTFEQFRDRVRAAKLTGDKEQFTYQSGNDTLVAGWDNFTINGTDAYQAFKDRQLLQDTSLTQMGKARLEKNGAVLIRGPKSPELNAFLQTFPQQKLYVAMNLLPNYLNYSFTEPGGVSIVADGNVSMGQWAVRDSKHLELKYHPFGGKYAPKDPSEAATVLFVTGAAAKPTTNLNGKDLTEALKAFSHDGKQGWLVPLTDAPMLPDDQLRARLAVTAGAISGASAELSK